MTVSRMLIGKPFHEDKYAPTGLQESQMHDFDMGYYTLSDKDPFRSIKWIEAENAYVHQYSLEELGRVYAYNRLQEYIPLDLYLNLPSIVVDDLITGLVNGRSEREEYDDEQRKKRKEENGDSLDEEEEKLKKLVERAERLNKI